MKKKIDLIKESLKKYSKQIYLCLVYVILMIIMYGGYETVVKPASWAETYVFSNEASVEQIKVEKINGEIKQEISDIEGEIRAVSLPVVCLKENNKSELEVILSDENGIVQKGYIKFNDLKNEKFVLQLKKPIEVDRKTKLYLTIKDNGKYVKNTGALKIANWNVPQTISYSNGKTNNYDLAMSIQGGGSHYVITLWRIIWIILTIAYLILCYAVLKGKWKVEQFFVMLSATFCLLYTFVFAPYSCPDEMAHINTTYYYSNQILHTTALNENGETLLTEEDLRFSPHEANTRKYSYYLYRYINSSGGNGHNYKVTQHRGPLSASPVAYAPQILAVVLARILGLGGIMRLLLGRLFASAFYILAGYYALKKMPFAKRAMMILMLGPSAIQQAASFSYDCVLNSCAFIFIALVLHCAYEKQHVDRKDWILLVVTSIVMSPIKIIYILITFCVFLIPSKKISNNNFKVCCLKFGVLLVNALCVLLTKMSSVVAISTSTVSNVNGAENVPGYNLSTIIHNPWKVLVLWANTLRVKPVDYLRHIFGGVEAANAITISWTIILGFFIMLVLALIIEKNETVLDVKGKMCSWIICLGLFTALFLVFTMEKSCTNVLSEYIMGIQGRYFFPFFPLLFAAIQGENIKIEKSILPKLAVGVYFFQFLTVCTIFETAVSR